MYSHFDPCDPLGQYYLYRPLPENTTKEDFDELQRLTLKYLIRTIAVFFVLLAALAVCSVFSSCATTKTEHDHTTHVVTTDSTGSETSHGGQVTSLTVNVDSIVAAAMERYREELLRQEQEHEITTETLTETIDSLGRIIRQSQKVTDRTTSKQEQQRIDRLEKTFELQIRLAVMEQDSLWQDRFSQYQTSMRDSLDRIRDLQKQTRASNPITWWQSLQQWLGRLAMIAVAVLMLLWILKKKLPWLPFGK